MASPHLFFLSFALLSIYEWKKADGCPQSSLISPPMGIYSCPGSNIMYTCVRNTSANAVTTAWSGSAFQCPNSTSPNQIGLFQRLSGIIQQITPVPCGSLSAVTTMATPPCYTSVLTIPAVQALNGATVVCGDGDSTIVGNDTLRIMTSPGPVGDMTVTSTSVDQLTVTWTPPTIGGVPTSYNVTINDSSSPVVIADSGSSVYTHTFTGLVNDTLYTVSVVAINCAGSSNGTSLTKWTLEPTSTTRSMPTVTTPKGATTTTAMMSSPPYWIIAIVLGVILLAVIVIIVVVCICKKKSRKGSLNITEVSIEIHVPVKKGDTLPPAPSDGYIDHVTAPVEEMQAMADKPTKTIEKAIKKPTATVTPAAGMYQDPKNIQHTTTHSGQTYALTEKKPNKPVDHVITPAGDMYAVADGNKKKR